MTTLKNSTSTRKRFLVVSAAGLAVLGPILGISFLGDTGTATATIASATNFSNLVYPVGTGSSMPAGLGTAAVLADGTTVTSGAVGTPTLPSWAPAANSSGQVTTPGDLALVNTVGLTGSVILNVYITNVPALQVDYSSFALPVTVFSCASSCTAVGSWSMVSNSTVPGANGTYLTNTDPEISLNLPAGSLYYDVTIGGTPSGTSPVGPSLAGGSYYCISTSATGGSLAPSFYFSTQAT